MEECNMELKRPGGALANRPLHFFWVVDCSGSMSGDKIDTVNHAIQECIQPMRDEAAGNPNAQLFIRTLKFSSGASWVTPEPVPIENFEWEDLGVDGITDLGKALEMVADQLEMPPMPARALPPVVVLMSDGMPTDAAAVSQPASVAADELPDGQNYQLVPPPAIEETQLDTAAEPESAEDVW